jgi:hypothetical protein
MSQQAPGPTPPGNPRWWSTDDWPDDEWPGDDDHGGHGTGGRWPPDNRGRSGRLNPLIVALVAIVAVAAGVGITLAVVRSTSTTPSAASSPAPSSQPSYVPLNPSAGGIPGGGSLPGGSTGGKTLVYTMGGKVFAVGSSSITFGGQGQTITAAVNSSTHFTGQDSSLSSIKPGDFIMAEVLEQGTKTTALQIQAPFSIGSMP